MLGSGVEGDRDPTEFTKNLERLVVWFRREVTRLASIRDEDIVQGRAIKEVPDFGRL